MFNPEVFKAYDVRGLYPQQITEELFVQLGRAFVAFLGPGRYAVTRDMRLSSPSLANAFIEGALQQGGHIVDYGLAGTDQMYFAVAADGLDGGAANYCLTQPEAVQRLQARTPGGLPPQR